MNGWMNGEGGERERVEEEEEKSLYLFIIEK